MDDRIIADIRERYPRNKDIESLLAEVERLRAALTVNTDMAWKAAIAARKEARRTPQTWRELEEDDPDTWLTVMRAALEAARAVEP